ncbi:MAG: lipoate--protein ligase [Bacteroidota bacterium]|nr:lipoate--protein ligase [Bacteroidota bacterium]
MSYEQLKTDFLIKSPFYSPSINLAIEEFFLKSSRNEFAIFYQNDPAVIIGKHQNIFAEVNYPFLIANKIPIRRRLSGGGTVYHDRGNLNFCFITNIKNKKWIDFDLQVQPIVSFLESLGLEISKQKNTSLFVNQKKISGNAEHIDQKAKRILHHGTLLINSNLEMLDKICAPRNNKFSDLGIPSVRSKVENLTQWTDLTAPELQEKCIQSVAPNCKMYHLTDFDKMEIQKIANEKYEQWAWNIAYGPKFTKSVFFKESHFQLQVKKGIIEDCFWLQKPIFSEKDIQGKKFEWNTIMKFLEKHHLPQELITKIFT